jgi:hypothetical protein
MELEVPGTASLRAINSGSERLKHPPEGQGDHDAAMVTKLLE